MGIKVRIVDTIPSSPMLLFGKDYEFIQGNLCDPAICELAVHGVTSVFHFAASMGGMGTIHEDNNLAIYTENNTMTLHLLFACLRMKVKRIFYASSACVYPDYLQQDPTNDVSLRENDVWQNLQGPPGPQGLYGLEKLSTELILHQLSSKIDVRVARFHNVYGPGGAWNNGREKAPAALLRKACALKFIQNEPLTFEVWGDGKQRRSFLYIDDAVDAVMRFFVSTSAKGPINIGSDESITVQELAELALTVYNIEKSQVTFEYLPDRPVGVASRNSDNTEIQLQLQWRPMTSILDGMRKTGEWIEKEMDFHATDRSDLQCTLKSLQESHMVYLEANRIVFAILLPITSRGCIDPGTCLENLDRFASSFAKTTWKDICYVGEAIRFRAKVYLAIDHDDEYLLSSILNGQNAAEHILHQNGISDVVTIICNKPRGHVCSIWRQCAERAWAEQCDYFVLMGDDVVLHGPDWMRDVHHEFQRLADSQHVPFGYGCVAFTDLSFPGMPTFPVVHRTHMDIFSGTVVPEVFINQDGDPFLFQLYRRWGCSSMIPSLLSNSVGGSGGARYIKQHATDWTFETLDKAIETATRWLQLKNSTARKMVTLDVVIPCYRVDLEILKGIMSLTPSDTCSVMFIIIIDNPYSPSASELERQYGKRPDVRIRRNATNIGASGSRNRGMEESAADWIIFLDDDIIAQADLLVEAEKVIREHPTAAGFVGKSLFPQSQTIFTTAVRIAGVAFFWDIATKMKDDLPWGVTANLIARRNIRDGVRYDLSYPKTGGGEDIEFCREKREFFLTKGFKGFVAAPNVIITHPWWNNGSRSYRRFYMWAYGDGRLVKRFPNLCYWDYCLNSAELFFLCGLFSITLPLMLPLRESLILVLRMVVAIIWANVVHDCYRHLWTDAERHRDMNTTVAGPEWVMAVIESTGIRMVSEMGRFHGMVARGEFRLIGRRFDWFAGRWGEGPRNEERMNNLQRAMIAAVVVIGWACHV